MPHTLRINEIFYSLQGEGTRTGAPCLFIRLTGCHLRCTYCDTEYAFHEGTKLTLPAILAECDRLAPNCPLIQVTGGEPLLQQNVHPLMAALADRNQTVLLETSGACDISTTDPRVIKIMDLKSPGSNEAHRNLLNNLEHLTPQDELKLVLTDRTDYDWAMQLLRDHPTLNRLAAILLSAVHIQPAGQHIPGSPGLSIRQLADWLLAEPALPQNLRLQTQLHKLIWDPQARGV